MREEAQREVVRSYSRLRSADAQPGSQSAYRITVRQLEALVRLSEALARVDCDHEVRVKHVREARRLLASSIISVEAADVSLASFDDEEEEEEYFEDGRGGDPPGGGGGGGDEDGGDGGDGGDGRDGGARRRSGGASELAAGGGGSQGGDGGEPSAAPSRGQTDGPRETSGGAPAAQAPQQQQQLSVSFENFQRVKQTLALRLKALEEEAAATAAAVAAAAGAGAEGAEAEADPNVQYSCTQGELVRWYLGERNAAGIFQNSVRPRLPTRMPSGPSDPSPALPSPRSSLSCPVP
jgi:DNA replication licensing factor MCM6